MEKQNLSHLKVGDKIARLALERGWDASMASPVMTHVICVITGRTKSRLKFKSHAGLEEAIRVDDGLQIGSSGDIRRVYFIEATPEMLEQHQAERLKIQRYRAAHKQTKSLIEKSHRQLNLTTEQLEALGKAWAEIQAMVK